MYLNLDPQACCVPSFGCSGVLCVSPFVCSGMLCVSSFRRADCISVFSRAVLYCCISAFGYLGGQCIFVECSGGLFVEHVALALLLIISPFLFIDSCNN